MVSWLLLALYGGLLVLLAPSSRDRAGFFEGRNRGGAPPSTPWLFASLFIAWIFAKSVTNAANLGAQLGLPGAVAYAAYWLSIPVGGLTIVALRRRFGATSLASWLATRYGRAAAATFLLAILIRLYNEVWSNTAVVGAYFGTKGSAGYYAGALAFTAVTLAYTLKGGLRTSIWTDAVHAAVFAAFVALVAIVAFGGPGPASIRRIAGAGSWTLHGGLDLLLVALIQALSYPFHDPVLTDRAFLSDYRTTRRAFLLAGGLGAIAIVLFGAVGVTAFLTGLPVSDDAPRVVAASLGAGALAMVNVVMLTSAGSTVDSAFSAVAKAVCIDVPGVRQGRRLGLGAGRAAMIAAALLGNLPLFAGAAILKATTISGTMVLGLAPVFLLGLALRAPPLSFHLAFWTGITAGIVELVGLLPPALAIGGGPYAGLLGVNVWGTLLATLLFVVPVFWQRLAARRRTRCPLPAPTR